MTFVSFCSVFRNCFFLFYNFAKQLYGSISWFVQELREALLWLHIWQVSSFSVFPAILASFLFLLNLNY